jgi:hypothetical protein
MENELLKNLDKLHTTELGAERIRKNLCVNADDTVSLCKDIIWGTKTVIERRGKNWYAQTPDCVITVNAYSYTIITAHKKAEN